MVLASEDFYVDLDNQSYLASSVFLESCTEALDV